MNIAEARALVTHLFGIIDGAEYDHLSEVFSPEAVYERPGYEALSGLSRIDQFYRYERIIGSGKHDVESVTYSDIGDMVTVGTFRGVSRSGDTLEERFADVYKVQGGKIIKRTTFFFRPAI